MSVRLIFFLALASGKLESSVVPYAINAVINQHFTKPISSHPGNVNVIWFGNKTKEISTWIDKLLKIKNSDVKIKITKVNLSAKKKINQSESSIAFFDSLETFKAEVHKINWAPDARQRVQHLVYVPGLQASSIPKLFPNGFEIDNVNFLMNETKKSIDCVSVFMFTEHACRKVQLKTINRFNVNSKKWDKSIFYPKKYRNFHGCKLVINTLKGENAKLMKLIFSSILNATVIAVPRENAKLDSCAECDLTTETTTFAQNFKLLSNPIYYEIWTFAVPPGEPYTELGRMLMIFSSEVYIAIVVILAIGVTITLVLNCVSLKIKNFIVGRNIESPTMNLVQIFMTGGQVRTPGRDFARFLVILFIVWSLIIRTCHQSMLFQLLQADLRKPTIKTLDELLKSEMTLHDQIDDEFTTILTHNFNKRLAMQSTRSVK